MFSVFLNRFIHESHCKLESPVIQSLIDINRAPFVCQVKGGHWLPQIHLLSRVAQILGIRHICTRDTKTYTHMLLWMKNDSYICCAVEKRQQLCSNGGNGHEFWREVAVYRLSCSLARRILVPWPGIKPVPPAVEAQSANHWTAKGSPSKISQLQMDQHLRYNGAQIVCTNSFTL